MAGPIINYLFSDYFRLFERQGCIEVIKDAGRSQSTAERYTDLMKAFWIDNIKTAGRPGAVFTTDFQRNLADKYPDYDFAESVPIGYGSRQPFTQIDGAIEYIDSTGVIDYCAILFEFSGYRVFISESSASAKAPRDGTPSQFTQDLLPGPSDGVEP